MAIRSTQPEAWANGRIGNIMQRDSHSIVKLLDDPSYHAEGFIHSRTYRTPITLANCHLPRNARMP